MRRCTFLLFVRLGRDCVENALTSVQNRHADGGNSGMVFRLAVTDK